MIPYEHGYWGINFIFKLRGSVFPKALVWSVPAALASIGLKLLLESRGIVYTDVSTSSVVSALSSFITVLGFMLVFRSNQAWGRYWEGAALVQQTRGEWFNAISSLFAFCSRDASKMQSCYKFHADVVRLMSLLFATALESLSDCDMVMLDQSGIDEAHTSFLKRCRRREDGDGQELRCEVILQWMQRFIVLNIDNGTLDIPAPILSRVFQELSRGVVNLASARKINELPFPFHYAQMLTTMLLIYTIGHTVFSGFVMGSWWTAGGATFFNVLVLWSVNYLAAEIEQPFGADLNDLPISAEMNRMNGLLKTLLHEQACTPPVYRDEDLPGKGMNTVRSLRVKQPSRQRTVLQDAARISASLSLRDTAEWSTDWEPQPPNALEGCLQAGGEPPRPPAEVPEPPAATSPEPPPASIGIRVMDVCKVAMDGDPEANCGSEPPWPDGGAGPPDPPEPRLSFPGVNRPSLTSPQPSPRYEPPVLWSSPRQLAQPQKRFGSQLEPA